MRSRPRFTWMSGLALAALSVLASSQAHATTFILGGDTNRYYTYGGTTIPAAPYNGQLVGADASSALLFYCIDESLTATWGQSYTGTVRGPNTAGEEEAAFLAAYALSHGAPSNDPNIINALEGPISMAIWQLTGAMSIPTDPAAAPYLLLAQNARANGLITPEFLSRVQIFVPDDPSVQRFMTAVPLADTQVPEPAAGALAAGALAVLVWRRRRRMPRPSQL